MAYGILAAHRGGLELLRRPEGGTIARLVLPVVGGTGVSPVGGVGGTGVSPVKPSPQKNRVLVVDDDPMILQLVSTTLERAGFLVQAVSSAEEALKSYSNSLADPFCLVLSDVLMPEVNGVDLARRLLAQDANVSVLFMSGQIPVEIMQSGIRSGALRVVIQALSSRGIDPRRSRGHRSFHLCCRGQSPNAECRMKTRSVSLHLLRLAVGSSHNQ